MCWIQSWIFMVQNVSCSNICANKYWFITWLYFPTTKPIYKMFAKYDSEIWLRKFFRFGVSICCHVQNICIYNWCLNYPGVNINPSSVRSSSYLILYCRKIKVINRFVTVCILVSYQWLVYSHIRTRNSAQSSCDNSRITFCRNEAYWFCIFPDALS